MTAVLHIYHARRVLFRCRKRPYTLSICNLSAAHCDDLHCVFWIWIPPRIPGRIFCNSNCPPYELCSCAVRAVYLSWKFLRKSSMFCLVLDLGCVGFDCDRSNPCCVWRSFYMFHIGICILLGAFSQCESPSIRLICKHCITCITFVHTMLLHMYSKSTLCCALKWTLLATKCANAILLQFVNAILIQCVNATLSELISSDEELC